MLISATWGLGSAIAQGEVVPDRIVLSRQGFVRTIEAGRKDHRDTCGHGGIGAAAVPDELVQRALPRRRAGGDARPAAAQVRESLLAMPVEIEWALDESGFKLLQARPLHVQPAHVPDEIWLQHPGLNGHPAGIGWGSGRAVVVNCECELSRVAPGDVLVTESRGRRSATSCRGSPAWWPSSAARPRISPRSRASAASRWCSACSTPRAHSRRRAGRGRRRRRHRAVAALMARSRASSSPSRSPRARSSGCARRQRQGVSGRQPHHSEARR